MDKRIFKELCEEYASKGTARYGWVTANRKGDVKIRNQYIGTSKTVVGVANLMIYAATGVKTNYTIFK